MSTSEITTQVAELAARRRVSTRDVHTLFRELEDTGEASLEALQALLDRYRERFTPNASMTFDALLGALRDSRAKAEALGILGGSRFEGSAPESFLELRSDGRYARPHDCGRWSVVADGGVLTLTLVPDQGVGLHRFHRLEGLCSDQFCLDGTLYIRR